MEFKLEAVEAWGGYYPRVEDNIFSGIAAIPSSFELTMGSSSTSASSTFMIFNVSPVGLPATIWHPFELLSVIAPEAVEAGLWAKSHVVNIRAMPPWRRVPAAAPHSDAVARWMGDLAKRIPAISGVPMDEILEATRDGNGGSEE